MNPPDSSPILWQSSSTALTKLEQTSALITQSRFFLPQPILLGHYGIIGMVIVDNKPGKRWCSYSDANWYGVGVTESHHTYITDPVQRAHFVGTADGLSIFRIFVLPPDLVNFFAQDEFLGEPMIAKCIQKDVFPSEPSFDEEVALGDSSLHGELEPFINAITTSVWNLTGVKTSEPPNWRHIRSMISFHGWFAYADAVAQAQAATVKGLANFDGALARFAENRPRHKLPQLE